MYYVTSVHVPAFLMILPGEKKNSFNVIGWFKQWKLKTLIQHEKRSFAVKHNFLNYSVMTTAMTKKMTYNDDQHIFAFHLFNTCSLPLEPLRDLADAVSSQLSSPASNRIWS